MSQLCERILFVRMCELNFDVGAVTWFMLGMDVAMGQRKGGPFRVKACEIVNK